jgi:bisphosphoglycerate-independent phosphoglycerate mutase (AlkP superfamily)
MKTNLDFYKKSGFFFLGVIVVMLVGRFTIFGSRLMSNSSTQDTPFSSHKVIDEVINWREADKYYGKVITVEGKIVRSYNSGKVTFLNFHPDYKRYFTAVIFKSDYPKFRNSPDKFYLNKKVQVSGLIKNYQGSPEIIINDPEQIKILKD